MRRKNTDQGQTQFCQRPSGAWRTLLGSNYATNADISRNIDWRYVHTVCCLANEKRVFRCCIKFAARETPAPGETNDKPVLSLLRYYSTQCQLAKRASCMHTPPSSGQSKLHLACITLHVFCVVILRGTVRTTHPFTANNSSQGKKETPASLVPVPSTTQALRDNKNETTSNETKPFPGAQVSACVGRRTGGVECCRKIKTGTKCPEVSHLGQPYV